MKTIQCGLCHEMFDSSEELCGECLDKTESDVSQRQIENLKRALEAERRMNDSYREKLRAKYDEMCTKHKDTVTERNALRVKVAELQQRKYEAYLNEERGALRTLLRQAEDSLEEAIKLLRKASVPYDQGVEIDDFLIRLKAVSKEA